mgnify:CR=1 FL=1
MTLPFKLSIEPSRDKRVLRKQLQAERQAMVDRHQRSVHLQEVLRVWLVGRTECAIGAYWAIKGEYLRYNFNSSNAGLGTLSGVSTAGL